MNNVIIKEFLAACVKGDMFKIKEQINNITLSDATDAEGKGPLILAVENGKRDVAAFLVETQNDLVHFKDKEGRTALHFACDNESKQLILFLLMNGANRSAADNKGRMPGDGNADIQMFIDDVGSSHADLRRREVLLHPRPR